MASTGAPDGDLTAESASGDVELTTAHAMIVASEDEDASEAFKQEDGLATRDEAPVANDAIEGSGVDDTDTTSIGAKAAIRDEGDDDKPVKVIDFGRGGKACGPLTWATAGHHLMPYHPSVYSQDWHQLVREVLAGVTVAFAQVSDSIAFAFIAGVGPLLGLHAAWIIGITMSSIGSRPGMINGATGVRAAVLAPYVAQLGVGYLFYIVVGISMFQFIASFFSLAKLVRLVTRPVMMGFVCGLAIVMAIGQVPAFYVPQTTIFNDSTTIAWQWFIIIVSLLGMVLWPYVPYAGKVLPPPLVGIFLAMALEFGVVRAIAGHQTPVVADLGKVSGGFPLFFWMDPQYSNVLPPLTLEVVGKVVQPAFVAAAAGMVEAVMTMEVANDMTETNNPAPDQQLLALGIGNLLCGLLGTMGGGATIGPTVIACSNGANGRYRLSGIVAGVVLLLIILVASDVVAIIPTSALVAVMAVVCWATFEWSMPGMVLASMLPKQARTFVGLHRKVRRVDAIVMVVVTLITVFVDLFTATLVGIGISAVSFSWEQAKEVSIVSRLVPLEAGDFEKVEAHEQAVKAANAAKASIAGKRKAAKGRAATEYSAAPASCDAKAIADVHPQSREARALAAATGQSQSDAAGDSKAEESKAEAIADADIDAAAATDDGDGALGLAHSDSTVHLVSAPAAAAAGAVPAGGGTDEDGAAGVIIEVGTAQAIAAIAESKEATTIAGDRGEAPPQKRVYFVSGCVFFASSMDFVKYFTPQTIKGDPTLVEFRFEDAAIGDHSGMHALGVIASKYARVGKKVVVKRLGRKCFKLVEKANDLIEHFEYEREEVADDDSLSGIQLRSRPSFLVSDGPVEAAVPMHIQASQPRLRA